MGFNGSEGSVAWDLIILMCAIMIQCLFDCEKFIVSELISKKKY